MGAKQERLANPKIGICTKLLLHLELAVEGEVISAGAHEHWATEAASVGPLLPKQHPRTWYSPASLASMFFLTLYYCCCYRCRWPGCCHC